MKLHMKHIISDDKIAYVHKTFICSFMSTEKMYFFMTH